MTVKLLPCPFCAGEAEFERVGTARVSNIVRCTQCGASLESGETFNQGTRWNDRSGTVPVAELAAEREKFTMHTAEVGAWLSSLTDLFGIKAETVADACSQIYDAAKLASRQVTLPPLGYELVPTAALRWLNGEGPDDRGFHFGDSEVMAVEFRGKRPMFWWRTVFNRMRRQPPARDYRPATHKGRAP